MIRFTETDKWTKDPWFRSLSAPAKLVFFYIIENCNNAGFLELDKEFMIVLTKMKPQYLDGAFKELERGIIAEDGWVWVRQFLKHQKNYDLNPLNPAHKQIIGLLREQLQRFKKIISFQNFIAPYKGLLSPTVKSSKVKVKKEESAERRKQAEEIYESYPRKVAKPEAIRAILKAIDRGTSPAALLERTKSYAATRQSNNGFTPNPSTWFNQDRFADDPKTWEDQTQKDKKPKEEEMRIV